MKFVVVNWKDQPLEVVIEPWASVEVIAPQARIIFESPDESDDGDPQLKIMTQEDGSLFIGLPSDRIAWTANGVETKYGH